MSQHTTPATKTSPHCLQGLLNPEETSDDAGDTYGNSKYKTPNAHLHSNGVWGSTANMHSTSEPRPTAQLSGPDQSMPTILPTSVGSMASVSDFSSANSSQFMNPPFPAIDAARGSPLSTSTATRPNSQPSMASLEAHIHPPPATTLSPRNVDWVQNPPTRSPDMPPHLGMPPPENATSHMPIIRDALFGVHRGEFLMNLPGSNDPMSVPIDMDQASKQMDEKRRRNAVASTKHRQKKKAKQKELFEELEQLRMEKKEWEEKMKKMEEDRDYYRDIIKQTPSLSYLVREKDFLSRGSNAAIRMDGLATRSQSYGGGSSLGERASKRRKTDQVPGFSAPAYRAFNGTPTSRRRSELPPKQNPQDTSTRWFMSQDTRISTPSSMVASVR